MSRTAIPVPLWWFTAGFAGAVLAARGLPGWTVMAAAILAFAFGLFAWRRNHPLPAWLAIGAGTALLSWGLWLGHTPWYNQGNSFRPVRLREITVRITDSRCAPELPWLGDPRRIRAEWDGNRKLPGGAVDLEGLTRLVPAPAYGDALQLTGTLYPGERFGAPAILLVDAAKARPDGTPGVQGMLLQLRNRVLDRLTRGLPGDRDRNTLAGMLFGCTQGLDSADRSTYVRTGVIHLFSVSGLHIGLLGALILGGLFWCPFRLRHWLALSVVFYVAMTGWQVPAVRTLVMFGVWCVARAQLYRIPPLRLVALAGCLILAWSPVQLWELGFQFSFLVTAALVAATATERRWQRALREKELWRPPSENRKPAVIWPSKIRHKFFAALFPAAVAYLAGCAITLYYQGVFAPVSVLANLGLIPIVTLLYPVAGLQLACGWMPGVGTVLTAAMTALLDLLDGLIRVVDAWVGVNGMTTPGTPALVVFYAGLGWLLLGTRRRWIGWAGIAAALSLWSVAAWRLPPAVAVFANAYREWPTIAVAEPAIGRARLVGAPGFENCRTLIEWLGRQGIRQIDQMALPYADRQEMNQALYLAVRIPVRELLVFDPAPEESATPWLQWSVAGPPRADEAWRMGKNGFDAVLRLQRHEIGLHLTERSLTLRADGKPLQELQTMRRNRPEMWHYELE